MLNQRNWKGINIIKLFQPNYFFCLTFAINKSIFETKEKKMETSKTTRTQEKEVKKIYARRQPEARLQEAIFSWARLNETNFPQLKLLRADPAGGKREAKAGYWLKRMGVKPGFPDLFLYYPAGQYSGLAIELKSAAGRLSGHQSSWLLALSKAGYLVAVCNDFETAIRLIVYYLSLKMG